MHRVSIRAIGSLFASTLLAAGLVGVVAGPASAASPPFALPAATLNVHCWPSGFSTINAAVGAARAGDTIRVCAGTYHEDVVVPPSKSLTIDGVGNPLIDATGLNNGVQILASNSVIEGFTIESAIGEGILVQGTPGAPVTGVTVEGNTVEHNDLGNPTGGPISSSSYPECNAQGLVPGDCGEGIHLMVAHDSSVVANQVANNSGGILLSDEFGPTSGNLIAFNSVYGNTLDCGITVVGHNSGAFQNGQAQPSVGGVFNNSIVSNVISGNGLAGQGAGVILATGPPGGAVYNNMVRANRISDNGLGGVTVHSHAPGQDLNGNVIQDNLIGTNNLDGDFDFSPFVDPFTTGVTVASVAPLTITIQNNVISNNTYGIWMLRTVSAMGLGSNLFQQVTNPVVIAS